MRPDCLGVIGLCELGGSVAWQAARAGVRRIIGYSRVRKDGVAAARAGAITEVATSAKQVARWADLIVMATGSSKTLSLLRELGSTVTTRSVYCTDLGGVKRPVVNAAARMNLGAWFAGSNALIELGGRGFEAARPDWFQGQIVYVTPVAGGELAAGEIADFWKRIMSAEPVTVDADRHDRILAWISHLPQTVASALATTLASHGPKGVTYGPVALSTTDSAAMDEQEWTDILVQNRDYLAAALDALGSEVRSLQTALADGDREGVRKWIELGSQWRRRAGE